MENAPTATRRTREIPRITVYARHTADCKSRGKGTRYTACGCPKQLCWYTEGKLYREGCGTDVIAAERAAREKTEYFEKLAKGEEVAPPTRAIANTRTLSAAIEKFLATKSSSGVTEKHTAKLKFELQAFAGFTASRGLFNLADITSEDCLDYRNGLQGTQNTNMKKIHRLIGFFKFCVEMDYLKRNPAQTQAIRIKASKTATPKAMDTRQLDELFAAIPRMKLSEETRRTVTAVATLMRWSGLAVRDAVTIERAAFQKNGGGFWKLHLYRAKTGHEVVATLEKEVVEQVFAGANPSGKFLFIDALPETEKEMDALAKRWSALFSKLGEVADIKNADGSLFHFGSHCLRHSWAAFCLLSGLDVADVAMLLGDSVEVVADTYSGWIHGRQERLTARLQEALAARHQKSLSAAGR